jgi:hypothetical protein
VTTKTRMRRDGLERQIEAALDPGAFVADRYCFSFVSDLEEVEREIVRLVETEPARAVALYEAFLAGCHEKAEEVDDSSGSFGGFLPALGDDQVAGRRLDHRLGLGLLVPRDDKKPPRVLAVPFVVCRRELDQAVAV